ncbi:glutathione S-transferase-like protein [Russula ochroleuca]|jgi:glutathione S-transferase|uniref:glutathione transferase n=1 Tax=Russula ochroleuca TaxID=152965 RepID=A0A9P5JXH2_9AGAM|nr:glutathione S-transferase-like protein [Russula ochroleuca]
MAFKLHGAKMSTYTRIVAVIAKERNVPYEFIAVDFKAAEHKQPPHLQHHPYGQVPYISQDDGFELYESRAIARYLATIGSGTQLIPTEPKAYAKFEQAASVEYAQFDPIASGIAWEKIIKPHFGKVTDEKRVEELVALLEIKLDGHEAILGKQKYLAGDEITLADLFHLPNGNIVFERLEYGFLDKRPNLQRWWKDISSRPSWQAVKDGA